MEPCDSDFYLENNVFPKKFKYIILKKRKIDSQNFECELRIALNDYDDVREWLKHFKRNTNTEWLLRQSTTCEENVLNQLYVCQNSSYGKKRKYDDDEGSKSDFNCKAAISVKIKKGGKRTYYQDEYVKKGIKGVMRICFIHTHLIDKAEVLNMARQSEETKKAFIGYFTEGMSPSEAIKNHEEILLLEGHEDLGDSRKNPPEHWVYSLYEEWTEQIKNRLRLESQLTRASVFWRLQNRSAPPSNNSKSKNIVKVCKVAEDINGMQVPADLHVSDDDDDSDSENQYDSYDEDSTPQVSTPYVSVSNTVHQATASSAPLKLNVPNNKNIARGCTLQVIKNNSGSNNKPSTNVLPLFVRIGQGTNTSQGNSVQIITTSHDNNKKPVFKFLTVSANSRKYTDLELGKSIRVANTPKMNLESGKPAHIINNPKEHQNVSESLPKCENITKVNSVHFMKTGNENNLKTASIMKPVFVRIKNDVVNKEAPSLAKSPEVQKEAETVLQQILTRFHNSDDKDDIVPNSKNKTTFQKTKVVYHRSDVLKESVKPVLKKSVQNSEHSLLSENLFNTNVLKDVQNQGSKDDQNRPKQVSKIICNTIIQQTIMQKAVTKTKDSVSSQMSNPSSDENRGKNDLKNIDQHKCQKSNHFVNSEMFQDCESESLEKLNKTDQITSRPANGSVEDCQVSSLVPKNYSDIEQAYSSSPLESLNQIFNQSGSVQSIKSPISSAVQGLGLSRPMFDCIDSTHKLLTHDTEVTSNSALHHENTFHDSKNLERLPIQGCPFPLPEDLYSTLAIENNSSYLGNRNGEDSQLFPLPLSKDLYKSNESNKAQILENQNQTDDPRYSLLLSATFCNSSNLLNVIEDSGNHSFNSDISYSLQNPDFTDSCSDMNSSKLSTEIDMSNEDSLQQIFPDLSKLEDELNNFSFEFPPAPNLQQVDLCCSHMSASNQLSLINTYRNSPPELQTNPVSLFENYEDDILPLPENLKGNIEDIDILKNILNVKCNKLESTKLEEFFQQPENYNQKEILEKWDSEMSRLRSLLEQNVHDRKLMREANQFLEKIKESVVTPSELATLFSSACSLKSKQKKY